MRNRHICYIYVCHIYVTYMYIYVWYIYCNICEIYVQATSYYHWPVIRVWIFNMCIQWWFINPDTFVPGRYFRINEFSGLLKRPSVQKSKSVPALFVRISEISGLSEPGLTNHHCTHKWFILCVLRFPCTQGNVTNKIIYAVFKYIHVYYTCDKFK